MAGALGGRHNRVIGDQVVIGDIAADQRSGLAAARRQRAFAVRPAGRRPVGFGVSEQHQTAHGRQSTVWQGRCRANMASETTEAQPARRRERATESRRRDLWLRVISQPTGASAPARPALSQDIDVDVCVIGAGLAGLTTALEVARRGWSVAVLEARRVAWNASGRNTGFVLPGFCAGSGHARRTRRHRCCARIVAAVAGAASIMCAETIADAATCEAMDAGRWLAACIEDRPVAALHDEAELHRSLGADVEFWPANLVRSKLKSEHLFSGGAFSDRLQHSSAQLCARPCRTCRAGGRSHLREYARAIDRSGGRAQAHLTSATAACAPPISCLQAISISAR